MRGTGACLLLLFVTSGCGQELKPASFVDKLRVLAVRAEPPEVVAGNETHLDLLTAAPRVALPDSGAPAALTMLWLACPLTPGAETLPCGLGQKVTSDGSTLSLPGCDAGAADTCLAGTGPTARLRTPPSPSSAATTLLTTVVVADDPRGATGCYIDLVARSGLPANPDHCVVALKRLRVAGVPGVPNQNPHLERFFIASPAGRTRDLLPDAGDPDGGWSPAAKSEADRWTLFADTAPDASELKDDGTREALGLSWFTTAGALDGGRAQLLPPGCTDPARCAGEPPLDRGTTTWLAPTAEEARPFLDASRAVDLWVVLRDDRGGVDWRYGILPASP